MKTATEKEIRQALTDNLTARGMTDAFYTDKVREYMDLWEHRNALKTDIKERGISIFNPKNGAYEPNKSIALEVQVSRQMLAIYTALGFKADKASAAAMLDDDEL